MIPGFLRAVHRPVPACNAASGAARLPLFDRGRTPPCEFQLFSLFPFFWRFRLHPLLLLRPPPITRPSRFPSPRAVRVPTRSARAPATATVSRIIYVSSNGRLFMRHITTSMGKGRRQRGGDFEPGGGRGGSFAFQGNRLVGTMTMGGGCQADDRDLRSRLYQLHGDGGRGTYRGRRHPPQGAERRDGRNYFRQQLHAELLDPERQCFRAIGNVGSGRA